ncbi:hypothetical protein [Sphingobacterium sp.]|uniref:hypothetical protein n=1 Tax=Sphingobacterium sp. TaxID=341027 RepID=UPI0028A6A974|nr:hypothetical protein [Sphingobacterium sp.]
MGCEDGPRSWYEPGCGSTPLAIRGCEDRPRSGLNQDVARLRSPSEDVRMDQDYNQMSLERPAYCKGVLHRPAAYFE